MIKTEYYGYALVILAAVLDWLVCSGSLSLKEESIWESKWCYPVLIFIATLALVGFILIP